MTKSDNPDPVGPGQNLTYTITVQNGGSDPAEDVNVTDTLQPQVTFVSATTTQGTCGSTEFSVFCGLGTVNNGSTVTITLIVNVKPDAEVGDVIVNPVAVESSTFDPDPANNLAVATTTVGTPPSPPSISKAFGAESMPLFGTTSLSFTLSNPNTSSTLNDVGFSDTLPGGLIVKDPNGLTGSCGGGTITADGGTNVISLSGATLAANASCTFSVDVVATTAGDKNNTTGNVTSNEGGTGGTASDSITVVAPPSTSKAFGASSIPLNGTTSLSFTITNPNSGTALSGVSFTDPLPSGLKVATPNGQTGSCGAGTITATAGSASISLSGGTLPAGGSCTFAANVTGTTAGVKNNSTLSVFSNEGGHGDAAFASITVVAPPSISKAFGATSIDLNGTTSLSFTITNPNSGTQLSGIGFTDTLPSGVKVASPNGLTGSCGGGSITAVAGSGTISLSGATLPASASCTFAANVTGTTPGDKNNTSDPVTSTEGGNGNSASASISVTGPPSISKAFAASSIPVNGTTSLSFTITNPNSTASLSGIAFSDTLPSGLVVATPNGLTNACGGSATAAQGTGTISLSGVTLAAGGSCTFAVDVKGTTAGVKNNTSGAVTSNEGGAGNTASATLTVVAPPSISKAFEAASVQLNGKTSLTFTITNPNSTTPLSGVGFSDSLPAGLLVASPNGLSNTCGGTATAVAGSGTISLSGATLPASGSCTLAADVTGTTVGVKNNTSGNVTSNEGGAGSPALASITVNYNVLGFFSPLPKNSYKAGATIPVKFALADVNGTRISDAEAQAIATSCRAQVRLDSGAPGCATYNATTDTFQFNLNTAKNTSKGTHTITLDVFVGSDLINTKSTTTTIK